MSTPGESGNGRQRAAGAESVEFGTPRSSIWQGFLGTASVVAYALLFELARNLVLDSFGENSVVQVLGDTFRWLSVLVIAVAVAYVAYRFAQSFRERTRTARELDLIADLVEPGPPVGTDSPPPRPDPPTEVSELDGHQIAKVLRDLPVNDYETDTLLAVLGAILDAPARLPSDTESADQTAPVLLDELLHRSILISPGAQRYCLRLVPLAAERASVTARPLWRAALPALVRHCADRATRWAIALESVRFAAGSRRWFEAQEPYLRALVEACTHLGADEIPAAVVPELARIGDALDVWYARIGSAESATSLASDLCAIPDMESLLLQWDMARMRAGRLRGRPQRYRPRSLSTSLTARWEHRTALRRLTAARRNLAVVERHLAATWRLLPREDVPGAVCTLINLAVVHIRQGRLDAAQDRVELAESLTRGGRDPGGRAHAHEIAGVIWWARGESRRALRCWQLALTGNRALADDRGTARCLQHLGSAMVVAPQHGGLLLGADPPLTRVEVLRQASGWLAESHRLCPSYYNDHYATLANSALADDRLPPARRGALLGIDRWPLPATDPAFDA